VTAEPMETHEPMEPPTGRTFHGPRCVGTSTQTGQRCGNPALPGGTVCGFHGGKAPQVKRKAALRLAALVDPAVATLAKEMTKADRSADRQRAANSILDRAGISRTPDLDAATARAILVERLIALRTPPPALDPPDNVMDAEIIEEERDYG